MSKETCRVSIVIIKILQVIKFLCFNRGEEERSLKSHHVAAGDKSLQQEQWLLGKKILYNHPAL